MPLGNGKKWALYLLMGKHADATDGKSAFRTAVENNTADGADFKPAFVAAAQALDGAAASDGKGDIRDEDVGIMPNLDPITMRAALGLDAPYPGGGGPCPDGGDEVAIYSTLANIP